jgi:hypothetical protein
VTNEELGEQLKSIGTSDCRKWSGAIFLKHAPVGITLKVRYIKVAKSSGYKKANRELRRLDERLTWNDCSATIPHKEVKDLADRMHLRCIELYEFHFQFNKSMRDASDSIRTYVRKRIDVDPFPSNWKEKTDEEVMSYVNRFFDESWWRRNISRNMKQIVEAVLRDIGSVRKGVSPYVSPYGFHKFKQGRIRNNQMIDIMMLVSSDDEVYPLRAAVDSSVSNPEVQRAELMVRLRGIEDVAKEDGLTPLFLTVTCPSKYHVFTGKNQRRNSKYQGLTPNDGMAYLNKLNSQIRADLHKRKIKISGFRIAEPHHDGTPHFHFLIYVRPEEVSLTKEIYRKHCLKEDGDENGADKYRFDVKELDLENGSATGYIAKYIAKNIDGKGIDSDYETGEKGDQSALRVKAWASTWCIRQFQPIGCPSQTVYREFRRLPKELVKKYPKRAERARKAADESDYGEYVRANGGLSVKQNDLPFRAMHLIKENGSKYGEDTKKIIGIEMKSGHSIVTRTKEYRLVPEWLLASQQAAQPPPLEYCQ